MESGFVAAGVLRAAGAMNDMGSAVAQLPAGSGREGVLVSTGRRSVVPALAQPTASAGWCAPKWNGHIPVLDGVRGIAILMVVVFHIANGGHHNFVLKLGFKVINAGWCGVDLFFVLSGFLITGILIDARGKPHALRNFYMRRFLRIFPLYYGVLIAVLLIAPLFASTAPKEGASQLWLWLYGTNIYPLFSGRTYNCPNIFNFWFGHFWSLAVEEQFYLFWPFVVLFVGRRMLMWTCVGLMAMSLTLRTVLVSMHVSVDVMYQFSLCRMDSLAAGAFLAAFARGTNRLGEARAVARVLAIAGAAFCGGFVVWRRNLLAAHPLMQTIGYTVLAVFFASTLLLVVTSPAGTMANRVCSSSPLRFLGKYSYGLYIFHHLPLPWVYSLGDMLYEPLHSYILMIFVRLMIVVAGCTIVALASWHLYEKHFLKLKARFA